MSSGSLPSFDCLIGGVPVAGVPRAVINPADGQAFAQVGTADQSMLDDAVRAAEQAFGHWRNSALAHRCRLLQGLADIVEQNGDRLARLLTLEQGKPLAEAIGEVAGTAAVLRLHASVGLADNGLFGSEDPAYLRRYAPLGVVAAIIPWNFPLFIAAMKIGPALLTGNAIIVKPAPTTPVATLEMIRLCAALVPPGLLQCLGDDGGVGPALVDHPGVAKIAFTGSTDSGRQIMAAAAAGLKRVTLELGGNDPAIILADADASAIADRIFAAAFTNGGQICGAIKRLYVHEGQFEAITAALSERIRQIVVGNGLDPATTMGPVQNARQYAKARALLDKATCDGRVLAQAAVPEGGGYFIPPSLITDLTDEHELVQEEQFAPILPILRFTDEEDVVRRANASPYGLTASIWSADQDWAERIAHRLEAGLVCVNRHNENPLGLGIAMAKQSGSGWLMGEEGVREYLQPQLVIR